MTVEGDGDEEEFKDGWDAIERGISIIQNLAILHEQTHGSTGKGMTPGGTGMGMTPEGYRYGLGHGHPGVYLSISSY